MAILVAVLDNFIVESSQCIVNVGRKMLLASNLIINALTISNQTSFHKYQTQYVLVSLRWAFVSRTQKDINTHKISPSS